MISSLANFLMLILYHGGFAQRVSWTLLMFTLGAVGIARIAIERDRTYSFGYAGILGIVTYVSMLRFVDSAIFSAFILAVIAYLADVIVRDCTLIDETVDASGQGLIDSGRLFFQKQIQQDSPAATGDDSSPLAKTHRKTHQPGRTVMYLALAALPLFGLGQFFLRSDPDTWARAQQLLAFYLFSSLSLLVTTSFLGLRRYLRQRHVEMPSDVSIAWLAGGLALIAAVLFVAHLAPLPGKALASFELPKMLDSPGTTQASRGGWGQEGADRKNSDAPMTSGDPNSDNKEVQAMTPGENAPEGDAGDGNRDQGPAGKRGGGEKQPGGEGGQAKAAAQKENSAPQKPNTETGNQQNQQSKPASTGNNSSQQTEQPGQKPSPPSSSPQEPSSDPGSEKSEGRQPPESESKESNSSEGDSKGEAGKKSQSQAKDDAAKSKSDPSSSDPQQQQQQQQQNSGGGISSEAASSGATDSPGVMETVANAVPMVASLLKLVLFLILTGIVLAFLWMNRHLIAAWWNQLFNRDVGPTVDNFDDFIRAETQVPPCAIRFLS